MFHSPVKIKLTTVFVDDQGKVFKFYTEILDFVRKADVIAYNFRWLTVVSPGEPDGTQLQLGPNGNAAAKTYRKPSTSKEFPPLCSSLMTFRKSISD